MMTMPDVCGVLHGEKTNNPYPELINATASVSSVFATPDVCLGSFEGCGSTDTRIYGEWILIDSFTRDIGIESYQLLWEYQLALAGFRRRYR